jgi:integrase
MAKKGTDKVLPRGIWQREKNGDYWIRFTDGNGKKRREKAGSFSAAESLLAKRKTGVLKGRKLPETLRDTRKVTISDLCDLAVEFTASHKSSRDYVTRAKVTKEQFGDMPAEGLTPVMIDRWLRKAFKNGATANRYRAFLSLCFREGMANGKVTSNPARLVRLRKESDGRLRYLSKKEYDTLCESIKKLYPQHLGEFQFACHTGARLSEQYSCTWGQYDVERRAIDIVDTKNGHNRTLHLNKVASEVVESIKRKGQKPNERIFPRTGTTYANQSWFIPCLEDSGITEVVWHSLRHTFCSWLALSGAGIKTIMELAGHRSISMSARYAHLSPDAKSMAVELIADLGAEKDTRTT